MKTLVLGARGQVGRALLARLGASGMGLDRTQADLERPESLASVLESLHANQGLSAVINAAAYTAVDLAETHQSEAHLINAESPGLLARWCALRAIPFIHYSTDYVFSGEGNQPRSEDDPVGPLNEYGRSKLEGERRILESPGPHLILRTFGVYDESGKNFLTTMLKLGLNRETLRVVDDQLGAPTYAADLAWATLQALENSIKISRFPSGVYHLSASGETSWHGFAEEIFQQARSRGIPLAVRSVEPISTSAYPSAATRPLNSRLDTSKAARILNVSLPSWQNGLSRCIASYIPPHALPVLKGNLNP